MFESKKTQIIIEFLVRTQKTLASRQKKFPSRQKEVPKGLEGFVHVLGKLNTPYVMFESKKLKFLD